MNILLINHYAGSPDLGMAIRPYYMAKEWQKEGHHTLIIGGNFSHLRKKQPQTKQSIIDEIHYTWIPVNIYQGNGLGRICSMFAFVFQLYFNFKKHIGHFCPNIVIASSTYPLDIYPARKIAKHYHAKLIYEVHDLWPLSPMELGDYSKKHPFIRIMQKAENDAYKYVDAVVSLLPKTEPYMREHGFAKKVSYVPNGIVLTDWETPLSLPEEHTTLLNELHKNKKFIVGYAGAHGMANSLQTIIDAVALLVDANVCLVLVGNGQEKENLIKYVHRPKIRNIYFLPPINKSAIPSLLAEMNVLYIGSQKQPLYRYGVSPNKIFDYMMSGKPIVQAIEAGNNLVREANCGMDVEPDNVKEISEAIITLKNMTDEERKHLGENGRKFVLDNHTYEVLGKRFLDIMTNLASQ
jgi:glycosyltransferase involved in cell wall biosynthesis